MVLMCKFAFMVEKIAKLYELENHLCFYFLMNKRAEDLDEFSCKLVLLLRALILDGK